MKLKQDIKNYKSASRALDDLYESIGSDVGTAKAMRQQRWTLTANKTEAAENIIMSVIGEHSTALARVGLLDFYKKLSSGKEERPSVLHRVADETVKYFEKGDKAFQQSADT